MTSARAVSSTTADDELRLARLHLRLGQLTLARAELEDLAGRDALGADGLGPLAEARWRTGDGDGAIEAATAHLAAGGTDEIAICIAAEGAAAAGDLDEARGLMHRLGPPDAVRVDELFAGMPQRATWPAGPAGPADAEPRSGPIPGPRDVLAATGGPPTTPASGAAPRPDRDRRPRIAVDPAAELRRARSELEARPERALVRLALVLRLDPTLAPAVLDAIALRREPEAQLIRGDAQRLLGRHLEAEAAFDAAAEALEG